MIRFSCLALFLAVTLLTAVSSPAGAQRADSIAAVVNGDIITYTDLYDRLDLVIKSSGMPNTREFRERLLPQVLTGLITETIQLQEAARLNIAVSDEEKSGAFAAVAESNAMQPDRFRAMLESQQVRVPTLMRQLEAQLAWGKVVQREIRPRVVLGDSDISAEIDRIRRRAGQTEYLMAEIFLSFAGAESESEVAAAARDLVRQIEPDAQRFPAAARQFSQSASAASGGTIGWMTADQMTPEMADAVRSLQPRTLSAPIRSDDGYRIVFIRDTRTIEPVADRPAEAVLRVKTARFDLPADNEAARAAIRTQAGNFARDVTGCLDMMRRAAANSAVTVEDREGPLDAFSESIAPLIADAPIGDATEPVEDGNAIIVAMVCGRTDGGGDGNGLTALEMEVEQRLGLQRLDMLQRRYLRDLLAEAYIERRV